MYTAVRLVFPPSLVSVSLSVSVVERGGREGERGVMQRVLLCTVRRRESTQHANTRDKDDYEKSNSRGINDIAKSVDVGNIKALMLDRSDFLHPKSVCICSIIGMLKPYVPIP